MKARILFVIVMVLALVLPVAPAAFAQSGETAGAEAAASLTWSVQYMIDQSQTVLGLSQFSAPRDNRGLAISPDGKFLYLGYNNLTGEVRKIDLSKADYTDATVARTTVSRGKAIAVDDQGRVYLADGGAIKIVDANLTAVQYTITMVKCEGVAVTREGSLLVLYATNRATTNTLTRWVLTESGGLITNTVKTGLGGTGEMAITGASDMRGVAVDAGGRVWIADPSATYGAGKVFRLNSDGTGLMSNAAVPNPYAIAFEGDKVLVTGGYSAVISVLDAASLAKIATDTVIPPWASLELDAPGSASYGGEQPSLSGIVTVPAGFYVTFEHGQTAGGKSTYGRTDTESGTIGGKFYTDTTHDDNEPLLFAQNPPPPSIATSTDKTVFCGENAKVSIALNDVVNLWGYQFAVSYDPSKASVASRAFVNSFFDTTADAFIGWNADCTTPGICKFSVSKVASSPPAPPVLPVSGSGIVATIDFAPVASGPFVVTVSNDILSDRDANVIVHTTSAPLSLTVCGFASASGKVTLQGRATPLDSGTVKLTDGAFGPYTANFSAANGTWSITGIKVMPGGTSYTFDAAHGLYLGNQLIHTLNPGDAYVAADTKLKGGDANNDGTIDITDLSCIGSAFGGGAAVCGTGSTDINADTFTNILDLVLPGGNYSLSTPQGW